MRKLNQGIDNNSSNVLAMGKLRTLTEGSLILVIKPELPLLHGRVNTSNDFIPIPALLKSLATLQSGPKPMVIGLRELLHLVMSNPAVP